MSGLLSLCLRDSNFENNVHRILNRSKLVVRRDMVAIADYLSQKRYPSCSSSNPKNNGSNVVGSNVDVQIQAKSRVGK